MFTGNITGGEGERANGKSFHPAYTSRLTPSAQHLPSYLYQALLAKHNFISQALIFLHILPLNIYFQILSKPMELCLDQRIV